MELKDKKYINNTKSLPGFFGGKIGQWFNSSPRIGTNSDGTPKYGNWTRGEILGNALPASIGFGVNMATVGDYDINSNDMLADAGMSNASIGGVGYRRYNALDYTGIHNEEHSQNLSNTVNLMGTGASTGAAIGSLAGPVGTAIGAVGGGIIGAIGGLFGGGKRHAEMRRQQRIAESKANIANAVNRSGAYTTYLQNDWLKNHGDTRQQSLYGAKDGKPSAYGEIDAPATAKVSNGEIIANKYEGTMYRVPGKKNNKDSELAYVRPSDTIVTNKYGLSDYVAATGDVETAEEIMKNKKLIKACNGKLPKFDEGWVPNLITSGLGMLGGLSQYMDARNQRVKKPNTYVANPYEQSALNDLAGLRVNTYSIMPEIYNQYAKATGAINSSGGLSGGQRTLARLSALNQTQQNTAKLLQAAQEQNNAYRANYAQAALNAGQADRQAMQQASQFDLDYYSKAHAARQQGMQMGMQNFLAQLQNYYANEFKRRQFNKMYGLYAESNQIEREKLNYLMGLAPSRFANPGADFDPGKASISTQNDIFDEQMRRYQNNFERDMKTRGFLYKPEEANAMQRLAHDQYIANAYNQAYRRLPIPDFSAMDNAIMRASRKRR